MQYAKRIIGFDVCVVKMDSRKIRSPQLNLEFEQHGISGASAKESLQSALPRKSSKIKYI